MTISLAFLAPALVQAAIEGRLPRGIGVTRLRDAPAECSRQRDARFVDLTAAILKRKPKLTPQCGADVARPCRV
jgi:hypothetical protein